MLPHVYFIHRTYNRATGRSGLDFVLLNPSDEHGLATTHIHVVVPR